MTDEQKGSPLNDGTHTILLSTKGQDKSTVPPELVSFLEYVANPSAKEVDDDSFVKSLDDQITAIKKNREWREQYMQLELLISEERAEAREEARAEGLAEGKALTMIELCCRMLVRGKSAADIADTLGYDISEISAIVDTAQEFAPDYDVEKIYKELQEREAKNK